MRNDPLFLLAAFAALVVVVVLAVGIGGFARGGRFNDRHGNRLMRWRIIAQAVAIVLILAFITLRQSTGG